ncbi:MAG TPA: GspE/PulE family protein [Acidimicrobiales bacterium]|nr:GspE/PulE family protein [Acidimicrobiales bacterium]
MALRRQKQRGPGLVTEATVSTPESDADEPVFVEDAPAPPSASSAGAADEPIGEVSQDAAPTPTGRIGEILVAAGAIDDGQLNAALELQKSSGDRLGTVLVDTGVTTRAQVTEGLATQYGLKAVALDRAVLDPKAVDAISEDSARALGVVPLTRAGDRVTIAVSDPARPGVFEEVLASARYTVTFVVVDGDQINETIDRAYQAASTVSDAVRVFEARASERTGPAVAVAEVDSTAPIVQVVNTILTQAVRDRASDVHIEPMGDRVRIRNRIDGALHEVLSLPQSMAQALVSRIKIMADMNIVERRRPQDGQMEAEVDGSELDIRVSTTSTQYGEKTVLRILDKARALYDLSTLGMPPETAALYADIIRSPYGMVVCAGPTGSGKTTTLYASLMAINSDEINVMTVEDPVEYTFPTINQISIQEQAGVTFAAGLRSILRQDPDAILVGEIRDVETARIAIQAALTGHFVLSTIHATDATSALHRFLDMGIESFLLASSMLAVVGQRLIRRNCTECLAPYEPSAEDLAFYERAGGKPKEQFLRGAGCAVCSDTGYVGRIGVYEVLRVTDEMRDLVVRNAPVDEIRKLAIDQGMVPLRDQALRLVADDVTTIAEVMRTIYIL